MKIRNILIYLLIIVVTDVLIFLFVKDMDEYQIASVAFINAAFVVAVIFSELYPKSSNSYVYSVSSAMFAFLYFIIELIIGVVFIAVDWQNVFVFIIQPVLLALFVIIMIWNALANFDSAKADNERTAMRKEFTTVLYPNMQKAVNDSKDLPFFKVVESAYDEVRSLPSKSTEETKAIDSELIKSSEELCSFVAEKQEDGVLKTCKRIGDLVSEKRTVLMRKVE